MRRIIYTPQAKAAIAAERQAHREKYTKQFDAYVDASYSLIRNLVLVSQLPERTVPRADVAAENYANNIVNADKIRYVTFYRDFTTKPLAPLHPHTYPRFKPTGLVSLLTTQPYGDLKVTHFDYRHDYAFLIGRLTLPGYVTGLLSHSVMSDIATTKFLSTDFLLPVGMLLGYADEMGNVPLEMKSKNVLGLL